MLRKKMTWKYMNKSVCEISYSFSNVKYASQTFKLNYSFFFLLYWHLTGWAQVKFFCTKSTVSSDNDNTARVFKKKPDTPKPRQSADWDASGRGRVQWWVQRNLTNGRDNLHDVCVWEREIQIAVITGPEQSNSSSCSWPSLGAR